MLPGNSKGKLLKHLGKKYVKFQTPLSAEQLRKKKTAIDVGKDTFQANKQNSN